MKKKFNELQISQDLRRAIPKEEVVIALEGFDFSWYPSEIELAKELWEGGKNIHEMAKELRPRNKDTGVQETFLLLFHLLETRQIKKRKNMWGFYY